MKKIMTRFLFILIIIFTFVMVNQGPSKAQAINNIIIHYHRFDHNYSSWDVWLWQHLPVSEDGLSVPFTKTDEFGVYAEINITDINQFNQNNPSTRLGLIIKKGNWLDREPGGDRFFNLTNPDSLGNVHIYLIQGDITIYTTRNEADISPRIVNASFSAFNKISFQTTDILQNTTDLISLVKVYKDNTLVEVKDLMLSGNSLSGTITLKDNINLSNDYTLALQGFNKSKYIEKNQLYDTEKFISQYTYEKADLGCTYTKEYSEFRVWAPTASSMDLILYTTGDYRNGSILDETQPNDLKATYPMDRSDNGTWTVKINSDLNKVYFTYQVKVGEVVYEVVDPYAKAVGVNGKRGMVIDLDQTNPDIWNNNKPELIEKEDSIIYELHIRDLSIHRSSNITHKGKFLGLTEKGTEYEGVSTGLSHLMELGITHLHILPSFDFRSVNETSTAPAFNWGYDPLNYNVPEGTYSTNPYHGEIRVNEFKQMVQALHDNGIRVVMDVVYNHLGDASTSSFQKLVPNYYFRTNQYGQFTNGSGVGNETASERMMMRKFIVDSVKYWASEYHVDGFRFDLMAVHDIETMNEVSKTLKEINPTIIVYGEGWTGGVSALDEHHQAKKEAISQMPGIAVFNDITRDGIKGSVWVETDKGFVQGGGKKDDIMFGIVGGITHPQTRLGWASDPEQIINYVAAHDNYTLWDKLSVSQPNAAKILKIYQDKQAAAIVLTSQGIPFIHAGQGFLRSKPYDGSLSENSYNLPDRVNQLRWDYKKENMDVFNYYKGLIELRKNHQAFRMRHADEIKKNLVFLETEPNVIAYTLDHANNDSWNYIVVAFNGGSSQQKITLPKNGTYHIVVDKNQAGVNTIRTFKGNQLTLNANETIVAYQETEENTQFYLLIILSTVVGLIIISIFIFFALKRRK